MNNSKSLLSLLIVASLAACGGGYSSSGSSNTAPARGTISGTVLDRLGTPVAGVTVTVYSNNSNTAVTTTTDANGAYAVSGLYSGSFTTGALSDYAVYAEKAGYGFVASVEDPAGVSAKQRVGQLEHQPSSLST